VVARLARVVLLASAVGVAPLAAQGMRYGVGGSGFVSLESGGGSDFGFGAAVDYYPGGPIGARLDGSWIFRAGDDGVVLNGDVTYNLHTISPSVHPFVVSGLSLRASQDFDASTQLGFNAGAGINFHLRSSPIGLWADGRFQHFFSPGANGLQFMAGVRLGEGE
jgi:hypothetical protein